MIIQKLQVEQPGMQPHRQTTSFDRRSLLCKTSMEYAPRSMSERHAAVCYVFLEGTLPLRRGT
jgi:hypothetical protein